MEQLNIYALEIKKATGFIRDAMGNYTTNGVLTEDDVISKAKEILAVRNKRGVAITSPQSSRDYIQLQIAELECEVFGAIFLDTKHRVLENTIMFRGTLDSASVPVREVVKAALSCNAGALIIYHNHPSGVAEPSAADKSITESLYLALGMVGVKLLDHFVCSTNEVISFAERGLLN
jgi:DNA repair protein RadC